MSELDFEACAICGRTILRGERVTEYVAGDGGRHGVCSLCKARAEASGWMPADLAGAQLRPAPRRGRGVALREALTRATERVRQPRPEPRSAPAPQEHEAQARPPRTAKPKPEQAKQPAKSKPRRASGTTVQRRLRQAVEHFNASEEARVVAGLIRSLGAPRASVQNLSAKPPRVAITVAWELSWYRWEVSQDGDDVTVQEVAKGDEVEELTDSAKRWNATVDSDGSVHLTASEARREAGAKAAE